MDSQIEESLKHLKFSLSLDIFEYLQYKIGLWFSGHFNDCYNRDLIDQITIFVNVN